MSIRKQLFNLGIAGAMLAAVLAVAAPPTAAAVQSAHTNTEVAAADVFATAELSLPSILSGSSELLYGGMTAAEAACVLSTDAGGISCAREWGDAIINGVQCAVGLFGVGRILMAKRIAKKIGEIRDAARRATASNRELLFKFLSLLAGECWDTYWAVRDLIDCMSPAEEQQQQASLPRAIHPSSLQFGKVVTA